jgi:hypothetical protein
MKCAETVGESLELVPRGGEGLGGLLVPGRQRPQACEDVPFLRLGLTTVTRDATRLAYPTDLTGGRDYTLHVKDLATGAVDPWSVAQF